MVNPKNSKVVNEGEINREVKNDYGRDFEISPLFPFENDVSIASQEDFLFDFAEDNPKTEKYSPFNNLRVINNSSVDIEVQANGDANSGIPQVAGTTTTFGQDAIRWLRKLRIKNLDGSTSINSGEIKVQVWRNKLTPENMLREIHKGVVKS